MNSKYGFVNLICNVDKISLLVAVGLSNMVSMKY
jgi:hypothetical protein